MSNTIIMINGSARSGKNTVVEYMTNALDKQTGGILHYSSTIAPFKELALNHFNWDTNKDEAGRKLLSDLKMAYIEYNPDFIINFVISNLNMLDPHPHNILVIDSREVDEIKRVKLYFPQIKYKVVTLLIERPDQEVPNNVGDMNVTRGITYDYVICNNGSKELLEQKVIKFMQTITT